MQDLNGTDTATRYDTAAVAPRDRFSFWREAVCDSFVQLGCEADNRWNFRGFIETERHSMLSVSRVSGSAHSVDRRKRDIRSANDDFFLLSLQTHRSSRITQYGSSAVLRPGDMAIYDSTDPYRLELQEGFAQTVVQLRKSRLLDRLPNAQLAAGHRIDGQTGLGKLVRENILAFSWHAGSEDASLRTMIQETLIDLIATGLAATLREQATLSSPEQHILLRAKTFIRNNLHDPDLDRNIVAVAMGMSVRRLNVIFAKEGASLADHIRSQRLSAVAADLRDSRLAGFSISEIAFRKGFSNLQHFSTLFKSHYGMTPKAWRLQDLMGEA